MTNIERLQPLTFEQMAVEEERGLRPKHDFSEGPFTMEESRLVFSEYKPKEADTSIKILLGVTQETNPTKIYKRLSPNLPDYTQAIFVMGGAGGVSPRRSALIKSVIQEALVRVAGETNGRMLVGDGGTESGVMEATGNARKKAKEEGHDFTLVGVPPREELNGVFEDGYDRTSPGTDIDPNHSIVIPVASKPEHVGPYGAWGNETQQMYAIFRLLAEGRHSIGIVANGGGITLNEVIENMNDGRPLIVLKGSGRTADGLARIATPLPGEEDNWDIQTRIQHRLSTLSQDSEERKRAESFVTTAGEKIEEWLSQLIIVDIQEENAAQQIADIITQERIAWEENQAWDEYMREQEEKQRRRKKIRPAQEGKMWRKYEKEYEKAIAEKAQPVTDAERRMAPPAVETVEEGGIIFHSATHIEDDEGNQWVQVVVTPPFPVFTNSQISITGSFEYDRRGKGYGPDGTARIVNIPPINPESDEQRNGAFGFIIQDNLYFRPPENGKPFSYNVKIRDHRYGREATGRVSSTSMNEKKGNPSQRPVQTFHIASLQ